MEPETSHRTTSGGWRRWGERRLSGMIFAPFLRLARRLARRSTRAPRGSASKRRGGVFGVGRGRSGSNFFSSGDHFVLSVVEAAVRLRSLGLQHQVLSII